MNAEAARISASLLDSEKKKQLWHANVMICLWNPKSSLYFEITTLMEWKQQNNVGFPIWAAQQDAEIAFAMDWRCPRMLPAVCSPAVHFAY